MKRLGLGVAVFAIIILLMALFERSLIFFPTRFPDGHWDVDAVAAGTGCVIEDCYFETGDGVRLHGWLSRRVHDGESDPVVLFFHGNAGNISHRADFVLELTTRLPAQVMTVGYRGYGRSEGRPSEAGLYADARAAWRFLTTKPGVDRERIVVFGKSLGGAVAVDLAMEAEPAGLIVESSFTSVPAMAGEHYPLVPKFLIRTRMDSAAKIPYVSCPKLFIHSKADRVVPFALGRELFEAAAEPKTFFEVVGAGHNETALVGGSAYYQALGEFVARSVRPSVR